MWSKERKERMENEISFCLWNVGSIQDQEENRKCDKTRRWENEKVRLISIESSFCLNTMLVQYKTKERMWKNEKAIRCFCDYNGCSIQTLYRNLQVWSVNYSRRHKASLLVSVTHEDTQLHFLSVTQEYTKLHFQ